MRDNEQVRLIAYFCFRWRSSIALMGDQSRRRATHEAVVSLGGRGDSLFAAQSGVELTSMFPTEELCSPHRTKTHRPLLPVISTRRFGARAPSVSSLLIRRHHRRFSPGPGPVDDVVTAITSSWRTRRARLSAFTGEHPSTTVGHGLG